jgi:hypothetical protein
VGGDKGLTQHEVYLCLKPSRRLSRQLVAQQMYLRHSGLRLLRLLFQLLAQQLKLVVRAERGPCAG